MKSGFILPFLILGLLVLGVYYLLTFSAIYPNKKTQETAQAIPKYATATSWQVINNKSPCLFNFADCINPPSIISFKTSDTWGSIYNAYKTNMGDFGWKTKSRIVTSVPTSIVFENEQSCTAELAENKTVFKERNRESETNSYDYKFKIVCKN